MENNTAVGYGTTMYDLGCADLAPNCGSNGAAVTFINNLNLAFPDPDNGGRFASGWFIEPGILLSTITADHNLWWDMRSLCPDNALLVETNYVCADPLLIGESNVDAINPNLSSNSPAIGAGTPVSAVTADFDGLARPATPSIGAFDSTAAAQNPPTQPPPPPVTTPPPVTIPPPPVTTPPPPVTTPPVVTAPTITWSKIANEGDIITIPAGSTVRFGALQSTPPGNIYVTVPLAADSFDPPITFATATSILVSNGTFGGDPAPNYVKELDLEVVTAAGSN
jgi:hypothetical protein